MILVGWRTLIVSSIFATLGVLQGLDWMLIVSNPGDFGWMTAGLALVMALLRAVTNTPVMMQNAVKSVVTATPGVAGLITTDDTVGRKLAASVPLPTVAIAGTEKAVIVATLKP